MREGTIAPGPTTAATKNVPTCDFRWIERQTGFDQVHPVSGPFAHTFPPAAITKTLQQRFQTPGGGLVWHDVPTVGQYRFGGTSDVDDAHCAGGHSHSMQLSRQERIQQHRDHVRRMFNDYSMRDDEIALPPELIASEQERAAEIEAEIASTRLKLAGLEQQLRDEVGGAPCDEPTARNVGTSEGAT